MQARTAILKHIDGLVMEGHSQSKVINDLVAMAKDGTLPADLAELVADANARSGKGARAKGGRTLSRATIYN